MYTTPTLQVITREFIKFFNSHALVKHVFFGDENDYAVLSAKEYISVFIQFSSSSIVGKVMSYDFSINIADWMKVENPTAENSSQSKCISIARDFIAWLNANDVVNSGANIVPFREEDGDIQTGVVVTLSLQYPLGSNACTIPFDDVTT